MNRTGGYKIGLLAICVVFLIAGCGSRPEVEVRGNRGLVKENLGSVITYGLTVEALCGHVVSTMDKIVEDEEYGKLDSVIISYSVDVGDEEDGFNVCKVVVPLQDWRKFERLRDDILCRYQLTGMFAQWVHKDLRAPLAEKIAKNRQFCY